MGGDNRLAARPDGIPEGIVRGVGDVNHDPETVAFPHHLLSEGFEAGFIIVQRPGAGVGPGRGKSVDQLQLSHAQTVEDPEGAQLLDPLSGVQTHDQGQLSRFSYPPDVVGSQGDLQIFLMLLDGTVEGVELPEKTPEGRRTLENSTKDRFAPWRLGVEVGVEVLNLVDLHQTSHPVAGNIQTGFHQSSRIEGSLRFHLVAKETGGDGWVDDGDLFQDTGHRIRFHWSRRVLGRAAHENQQDQACEHVRPGLHRSRRPSLHIDFPFLPSQGGRSRPGFLSPSASFCRSWTGRLQSSTFRTGAYTLAQAPRDPLLEFQGDSYGVGEDERVSLPPIRTP